MADHKGVRLVGADGKTYFILYTELEKFEDPPGVADEFETNVQLEAHEGTHPAGCKWELSGPVGVA